MIFHGKLKAKRNQYRMCTTKKCLSYLCLPFLLNIKGQLKPVNYLEDKAKRKPHVGPDISN